MSWGDGIARNSTHGKHDALNKTLRGPEFTSFTFRGEAKLPEQETPIKFEHAHSILPLLAALAGYAFCKSVRTVSLGSTTSIL